MKKYIILLCVILLGTSVFASDYNVYKSKNGQTIIIQQVKSNPIVIIDTWVKTGSINENDQNTGVSHFLEHLFFKGTEKNPTGTFDHILEAKGGVTNAATSKDFTHYYIKIPSKEFDLALDLHADMLMNPKIPENELEKERKVVLEEIAKDKNSPSDLVYDNLNELLYQVHPYKREVIGKSEVIKNISRDEIFEYYNTHYAPANMITVIVGDVDPDEAAQKVMAAFNPCGARKVQKQTYKKEPPILTQRVKEVEFPCNSGYMMIGFQGTNAVHKDEFALDILSTILGSGRSSRFYQNIKEQKQLAFSISSSNASYKDNGTFFISSNFQPENKDKLKSEIFKEIKNIQKNGVTDEEVQRAKNIIKRDTHYSRESVSNIASEMGYTVLLTGDAKNYDGYLKGIDSVTKEEVQRVANKYLQENHSAISVVMPEGTLKNTNNKEVSKKIQHKTTFVKSAYNTDKYLLDNGATLLLNSHKNNDIVAIAVRAKGGDFLEKTHGTSDLTASVMLKGTKNYTSKELSNLLEEKGITIAPGGGNDYFVLNVITTKEELPLTLELLDEIVNNALYDQNEINKVRKNLLDNIKASRDVPQVRAFEEYEENIYTIPVYANGTKSLEKSLPKVQRNEILEYYHKIFYPKNLVIAVSGDVDKDYISDRLSEIFNSNQGTEFSYQAELKNIPNHTKVKKITTNVRDLQTAWIILGWQTAGNTDIKDSATLQVINAIMGTGMSSRLFKALREELGLAYQVGSSYSANVLKGKYTMYIGTNPKTADMAEKNMMKQISILKTQPVSEKELQEAKDQLIGKYVLALETNLDKASALALYEITDRGFDFVEKYSQLIQNVTSADIKNVANKYFKENYVESIVDKAK